MRICYDVSLHLIGAVTIHLNLYVKPVVSQLCTSCILARAAGADFLEWHKAGRTVQIGVHQDDNLSMAISLEETLI